MSTVEVVRCRAKRGFGIQPALRLDDVSLRMRRGLPWLLDAVTLDFAPGTITTVTGPNGSGKSSLLRIVAGLMRPTLGSVSGRPAHVGFCPERLPGKLRLSTTAYLHHLASIHQHPELVSDAESALRRMNFIGDANVPMSSLSKGNVQKVLLATALGLGAPLLVLDEPWSGLDSTARDALTSLLREQASAGRIVVLADHPAAADDRPFQRVLELRAGHVVPRSEPRDGPVRTATLMLRPPDSAIDHAAEFRAAEVAVVGDHVRVACTDERVDALLSAALSAGYSVLSVQRSDSSFPAPVSEQR